MAYLGLKWYEKAIEDLVKLVKMDSSKSDKYYNDIGVAYYNMKDYNQAIEYHTKAIEIKPEEKEYYINRARDYFELKKYEEAVDDWKSHDYVPSDEEYRIMLEYYQDEIQKKPSNIVARYKCGEIYHDLGYYDKAKPYFKEVLKLNDKVLKTNKRNASAATAHNINGLAYQKLGDHKKAVKEFTQAIKIASKSSQNAAKYYENRSISYRELGKYSKAEQDSILAENL